jgi:hypothetical protein
MAEPVVYRLLDGEACVWIEQASSIHLKVVTDSGDPAELNWNDARELGELLVRLAKDGERKELSSPDNLRTGDQP